jgi:hypothetical protein
MYPRYRVVGLLHDAPVVVRGVYHRAVGAGDTRVRYPVAALMAVMFVVSAVSTFAHDVNCTSQNAGLF